MGSRKQRWFWTVAAVGLTFLPLARQLCDDGAVPRPLAFAIAPPVPDRDTNARPQFASGFIDAGFLTPSVHVASLCEISGGRLLAAWYGGTREGARDVKIYTATLNRAATNWSAPRVVVTRDSAQRELGRYVKKVGNALLFSDGGERVNLLYVAIAFGGWSGSSLNLKTSADGGQTWGPSERLQLSPFFNISELVKNQPAALRDGGWAVPIYHEVVGKFSELLWLSAPAGSLSYHKTRVNGGATGFQPALVPLSTRRALLLARDNSDAGQLWASRSEDAGDSWSALNRTGLPNPFSGLDAIRLRDSRVLLAFNDTRDNRGNLRLAVSADEGDSWQRVNPLLEEEAGQEFSYPFLLQSSDGLIHLVYTWKRKGIRHASFNSVWLDTRIGGKRHEQFPADLDDVLRARDSVDVVRAGMVAPRPAILSGLAMPKLAGFGIRWRGLAAARRFAAGNVVCGFCAWPEPPDAGAFGGRHPPPRREPGGGAFLQRSTVFIFAVLAGVALYPSAMGWGRFDVYTLGWNFSPLTVTVGALSICLIWRRNRFNLVLLVALLAWQLGVMESRNLWDYLVDPILFLLSMPALAGKILRRKGAVHVG